MNRQSYSERYDDDDDDVGVVVDDDDADYDDDDGGDGGGHNADGSDDDEDHDDVLTLAHFSLKYSPWSQKQANDFKSVLLEGNQNEVTPVRDANMPLQSHFCPVSTLVCFSGYTVQDTYYYQAVVALQ